MNRASAVVLGVALVGFASGARAADADPAKLVGSWVITKAGGDGAAEGTLVDFAKDGKVVVVVKSGDKEAKLNGTYKLAKDKLTVDLKVGEKATTEVLTVKKLTDTEMELEDKDMKVDVLKKKK